MQYRFLNIFLEQSDLLKQSKIEISPFLIENNTSQIEKLYEFYKGNANLLYVNGFTGTGKADIVNYSTAFLSDETIILKYNCFNSTILDDILLSFFQEFKKLSSQNIITEPKVKTENFTQKINSYFAQVEKPFVVILDSFEAILDENRQEILDFIFHINSMQKVKTVIIGRTFESKYFKDLPIERVITHSLERPVFEKLLKSEKIKSNSSIMDDFYQFTRGYYLYTALSAKLIKNQNTNLQDFISKLKDSFMPFSQFLSNQAISLIPNTEKNLFWFLSVIRHPVSIELLKKIDFYNKENLDKLIEDLVVFQDNDNVYVQDYLRNEVDKAAPATLLLKIRQYIIDLYQTQLPLKPMSRDICISRQTMRKEIEFQTFFLPKKPKFKDNVPVDINYLSYSKVFSSDEKSKNQEKGNKNEQTSKRKPDLDFTKRKNISINLENLMFQNKDRNNEIENQLTKKHEQLSFNTLVELIKDSEKAYDYNEIISLCLQALEMKNEELYQLYLPFLYSKIAHAYQKIARHEDALKYYELAKVFYEEKQDYLKLCIIKLSIANVFYETYKFDKAKELFTEIAKSNQCSENIVIRAYMQLAGIEEDSSDIKKALEYYNLALELSSERTNEALLSELYFKYALLMDDGNNLVEAIKYYDLCINISSKLPSSKFISPAYSNIANLYLEKDDSANAVKNYTKAYEIDKENKNYEGVYDSASKLASILQRKEPQRALEFFNVALDYANKIQDVFYIISASLALGDYYYEHKEDEFALKYYIKSMDLAKNNLSHDNIYKINVRINDVKFRLGAEVFDNLVELIYQQEIQE